MSLFSTWDIVSTLQSSLAQQKHLSFPFVSIKGSLKEANLLQLDSCNYLKSYSIQLCVICSRMHFLCNRMSSNPDSDNLCFKYIT